MFILKGNSLISPQSVVGLPDLKLFKRVGVSGILKLENAKAILTRLCNSGYIPEGNYQN